ncbi:TOBE domain-containing protein [Saccharolobus shibatae]|nr:TOBE domain-containing protein [Saccharolobus shibatae]
MRDSARALVKEVQSRLGVTLLVVSHDPADIFAIADRVGVLVKGKLVQVGKPEDVYDNPVSIQVASLIGEINELEGKVTNERIVIGSFRFPVSVPGDRVIIGIRPEDVKISKDVIRDDSWILVGKGRVKVIGYQGGLFRITITPLDSEEEMFTYSDHPMHSGEEVLVYVKKDKIKVFEKN